MVIYYLKSLVIVCVDGKTCIRYVPYGHGLSLWFLCHSHTVANAGNEQFAASLCQLLCFLSDILKAPCSVCVCLCFS